MQICAPRPIYNSGIVDAPAGLKFVSYTAYGLRIGLEASFDLLPFLPSPLIPGAEPGAKVETPGSPFTCFQFQRADSENGCSAFRVAENGTHVFLSSDIALAARTLESR